MSDDDNWDDEFEISPAPSKLSLPSNDKQDKRPTTLFNMDAGDAEEDWSNDFETASAPQKILGIKADPNAKEEDWDDDFDFNNENGEGGMLFSSCVHCALCVVV